MGSQSETMAGASNVTWHAHAISRAQRETLLGQRGMVLWLTGLSGSGKSTIANAAAEELHRAGHLSYLLDGDNVRHGLNRDLGFSPADRTENIRRVAEVAHLFVDAGLIVFVSFISPYRADRDAAHELIGDDFFEVFIDAPLAVCEQRDPKGLYKKARAGTISDFTGVSAPYEPPVRPALHLRTDQLSVAEAAAELARFIRAHQPQSPS